MYYCGFNFVVNEIFKSCGKDINSKVHVTGVSRSYVFHNPFYCVW